MENLAPNNKRIVKNTLLLYVRMLFLMVVSLYTSRVVLNALGIEDFGIYNVVGGMVAMFSMLSGSLSAAITRFITYELGRGDREKLRTIFSSAVTIQLGLAAIIIILAEVLGIWFLNSKMTIPLDRLAAANWVFQFSVLTFAINLVSVPYNASIIAHERMSAFAYISIFEAVGKLAIAYLITISPIDRLVFYAILMCAVALIVRFTYGIYCKRHFEECMYHFIFDKNSKRNTVTNVNTELYTSWESGSFIFKNIPLESVMSYLSKWYGFKYTFEDDAVKQVKIGAYLNRYANMNPIIDMIKELNLVDIKQREGVLHISYK